MKNKPYSYRDIDDLTVPAKTGLAPYLAFHSLLWG